MLSLQQIRKIDPTNTHNLTDIELEKIRIALYEMAQLTFEDWLSQRPVPKNPLGLFTKNDDAVI